MNAVEREPVPTRIVNLNASYKPKQRSYRKTKLKKNLPPDSPGAQMFDAQTAVPKRCRPNGGAQKMAPKQRCLSVPDPDWSSTIVILVSFCVVIVNTNGIRVSREFKCSWKVLLVGLKYVFKFHSL